MSNYVEHQTRLADFVKTTHEYPAARFTGRGIVICAGGPRYFTNAYVCVRVLRMHGCALPIQFCHLGPDEMTDEMREIVKPLGVECVDAYAVREEFPARILNGWELKPYAMIHSPFAEVICLDADNVALRDPTFLFDTHEYQQTGAIFWPDYGRLARDREIWKIMELEYRDEPEFESGQIVVDKARCWKALQVTMHLNEYSDFYYKHIHGDKETFHMAWRKVGQEYAMPQRAIHGLPGTMCQHDFAGNRIFQHRNMRKWTLTGQNEHTADFKHEDTCLQFLEELRLAWGAAPKMPQSPDFKSFYDMIVAQRRYLYTRVGYDARSIELLADGQIAAGPGAIEHQWVMLGSKDAPRLGIFSDGRLLMDLKYAGGMFHGQWLMHERMPIVLTPEPEPRDRRPTAEQLGPGGVFPETFADEHGPPEPDPAPSPELATLHLGCGGIDVTGAVNHDLTQHSPHVHVAHDLNVLPWPWPDAVYDRVIGYDVFEHLSVEIQQWLDECWRILKPGGLLELRVPLWLHENAWTDPTHKRAFTPKTFDYWDKRRHFHKHFGHFYFAKSNKWWHVELVKESKNLTFKLVKDV